MILDGLGQLLGIVVALAAVSGLAFVAIWLMKRLQIGVGAPADGPDGLRYVRALPLGPRERLVVVEWRGETLLLGVTAGGISLVSRGKPSSPTVGADPS